MIRPVGLHVNLGVYTAPANCHEKEDREINEEAVREEGEARRSHVDKGRWSFSRSAPCSVLVATDSLVALRFLYAKPRHATAPCGGTKESRGVNGKHFQFNAGIGIGNKKIFPEKKLMSFLLPLNQGH